MKRENSIGILIVSLFLILLYTKNPLSYGMHGGMGMRGGFFIPGLFGPLFWVFLIIFLFYILGGNGEKQGEREEAIEILKKRYAKGEISREEYLEMFKDIMKK